jgi:cytochrome oxidase assembly protein ShyY1
MATSIIVVLAIIATPLMVIGLAYWSLTRDNGDED